MQTVLLACCLLPPSIGQDVTQKQPIRRAQAQQPEKQGEQEQQEQQEQEQQAAESLPVQESAQHPRG
jgi:hypothetical protein